MIFLKNKVLIKLCIKFSENNHIPKLFLTFLFIFSSLELMKNQQLKKSIIKNPCIIINIFIAILLVSIIIYIVYTIINNNYSTKKTNVETFDNHSNNPNNEYILPKKVYAYWDNLGSNPIIQAHLDGWKNALPEDWEVIILNKVNVKDYVGNDFMTRYGKLDATRFADFLRLELLSRFGGVWMDGSVVMINASFLEEYHQKMMSDHYDACMYELDLRTLDKKYPYLENWFIMAPKGSPLINDMYKEFDKSFQMGFLKYKTDILIPSGVELEKTLGYGQRTYLMQHAIIHYLLHQGKKYNILINDAKESMFRIHCDTEWKDDKIINFILNNDNWKNYYAIKLVKSNRRSIRSDNQDSYIQKILNIE